MTPAKRGDLVLVVEDHSYSVLGMDAGVRTDAMVGIVIGIDRKGFVTRWRSTWSGPPCRIPENARVLIVSAAKIDVAAAMEAAIAHTWPGHDLQPMPFGSIDEARDFLRPFIRLAL